MVGETPGVHTVASVGGERLTPESFTCPKCERTSYNPMDVHEQYCGSCHEWFNDLGPRYFDRDGQPISLRQWADRWESTEYRRIAETYIGKTRVSTVWLGLDHGMFTDERLIFETMVFGPYGDRGQWRWTTEKKAIVGHKLVVYALRQKMSRKVKKRILRESYCGTWGDIKNRSHWRTRSPYMRPFSNPRPLSKAGRLVSRKYHARTTRRVRR